MHTQFLRSMLVALVLLLAFCSDIETPVTQASSPLTISEVDCESGGGGRFSCFTIVSGGSGSYSYTWEALQNAIFDLTTARGFAYGRCGVGGFSKIRVTVKDSAGATVSHGRGFVCSQFAP